MYCPNCATQKIEGGKFCRKCGTDLSLVPQALSGHFPQVPNSGLDQAISERIEEAIRRRIARAARKASTGLAFLIAFAAIFFTSRSIGGAVWLLIPAFLLLGKGVGELVSVAVERSRENRRTTPPAEQTGQLLPPAVYDPLAPPSVTERTTRHLEAAERDRQRVS